MCCRGLLAARYLLGTDYTWRRKLRKAGELAYNLPEVVAAPTFAEAAMDPEAATLGVGQHPAIVVDLRRGKRLSIFAAASPALIGAALKALR